MQAITSNKFKSLSLYSMFYVILIHCLTIPRPMAGNHITFSEAPFTFFFEYFVSQGLGQTGLPMFFVISGFFLFYSFQRFDRYSNFYIYSLKSRARSIALPYLLWSLFWILFYIIAQSISYTAPFFNKTPFLNLSFPEKIYRFLIDPIPFQFWYLQCLMIFVLVSPLFYYSLKQFKLFIPIILFILWLSVDTIAGIRIQDIFFFATGAYFSVCQKDLPCLKFPKTLFISLSWLILLGIDTWYLISVPDSLIPIYFQRILRAIGVFVLWISFDYIPSWFNNWLLKYTGFTFFIFAFHEPFLTIIIKILAKVHPVNSFYHLNIFIVAFITTSLFSMVAAVLTQRLIPKAYKLLTGGR